MLHSPGINNKINSLWEKAIRITCGDKISSFHYLAGKDNPVSIPCFNMAPETVNIFKPRVMPYKLRIHNCLESARPVHSVFNSTETLSYLGPKI